MNSEPPTSSAEGNITPAASAGGCAWMGRGAAIVIAFWGMGLISEGIGSRSSPWFPIWLPSGISFAALLVFGVRYWPAVAIGAVLSFVWILVLDGTPQALGQSIIGISGAALGESLGVLVGVCMFKRGTIFPRDLHSERGAILFFVAGTLIGPTVTSLIITVVWSAAGLIPGELWLFTFLTLMLARAAGVSTVSPLLLLSETEVRRITGDKVWVFGLAGGTALLASVAVLGYVAASTERKRGGALQEDAKQLAMTVEGDLEVSMESVESIQSLWDSSREVDRSEFQTFCRRALSRSLWIEALMWAPKASRNEAERLESLARGGGGGPSSRGEARPGPDFSIRSHPDAIGADPAGANETGDGPAPVVPVVYFAPEIGRDAWLGLDLQTFPEIAVSLKAAEISGAVRASKTFHWPEGGDEKLLLATWMERPGGGAEGTEGPLMASLSGYAIALVNLRAILKDVVEDRERGPFEVAISENDESAPFLIVQPKPTAAFRRADESVEERIQVAGRTWVLRVEPHQSPRVASPAWNVVATQSGVFLVTALLGAGLLAGLGHQARVNMEVRARNRQLAEFEERFRQVSERIDEVFWISSADYRTIEFLSHAYEKIWGLPRDLVMREPGRWLGEIHEADRDKVAEHFSAAGGAAGFDVEFRIIRPDGKFRWIRCRAFPVIDEKGAVIRVAGVAADITSVKRREKTLRDAKRETEEAGRILERFFFVALDMLCIAGLDGYFKRVNPAFSNTLGYDDEELLGTPFLDFVHPDDAESTLQILERVKRGEEVIRFENRIRHRDGSDVWIEWNAAPDPDHPIFYAAARDVTRRRAMEDELRRSNEELEQFAYVASHDLQEPLRMVTSFVQLLEKRYAGQLDEQGEQYIHFAVDGAARMRRLILGLLELSRVGRRGNSLQPVDANLALDEALKYLALLVEESQAVIERGDLPRVLADSEQLTLLFQNLIGNAIKFSGDSQPRLTIGAKSREGYWEFSVEDRGVGIPREHRERVFQIFQRLQPEGDISGTGIGLAICRRILERHGGRIWVDEKEGPGARICFTLKKPGNPHDPGRKAEPPKE